MRNATQQGSALYLGDVMHKRYGEIGYQFRYGVTSLRIDIDQIEQECQSLRWLSLNRFNLLSIHYKDYGDRSGKPWRAWAEGLLAEYGITKPAARIELVCFPRFMGYSFNPLAVWYAYDACDRLIAIIAEVSNTFGQWHHYVLSNANAPLPQTVYAMADKVFHVSPFLGMNCHYHFTFQAPTETHRIVIKQTENGQPILLASQSGKALKLTDKNLLKAAMKHPFNTLKVMGLIHWWALKILLKGGKFHKTPKPLESIQYSHTRMNLNENAYL